MRAVLLIMTGFITLTALPAGLLMMLEPNGSASGLNLALLSNTPFNDFFIPGLLLALVVGGSSAASLFLVMNHNSLGYKIAMAAGAVLILWAMGELILVPYYNWLQGIYLLVGVLIILTSYQLTGKAAF